MNFFLTLEFCGSKMIDPRMKGMTVKRFGSISISATNPLNHLYKMMTIQSYSNFPRIYYTMLIRYFQLHEERHKIFMAISETVGIWLIKMVISSGLTEYNSSFIQPVVCQACACSGNLKMMKTLSLTSGSSQPNGGNGHLNKTLQFRWTSVRMEVLQRCCR